MGNHWKITALYSLPSREAAASCARLALQLLVVEAGLIPYTVWAGSGSLELCLSTGPAPAPLRSRRAVLKPELPGHPAEKHAVV